MNPLRLAVIGAGHLGKFHARLALDLDLFQLVGVVDRIESVRQQAAAELEVAVYSDHHALNGKIDAAVVAAPTVHHHSVTMDLLRQGIHVFVEKPLAATSAQAREMVQLATEQGLILQVGHIEQFNPAWETARNLVERPFYIDAVRTSGYTFRSTDIGVVLDLMIHDLDIVFSLVNSPIRDLHAIGTSVMGNQEDMAQARLLFENGCVANFTASRVSYDSQRTMQVFGDDIFMRLDFSAPALRIIRPASPLCKKEFDVHQLTAQQREHYKEHLFEELLPTEDLQLASHNALLEELKDFGTAIQTRCTPRVTGQQGYTAVLVAEHILSAIATHAEEIQLQQTVRIPETSNSPMSQPAPWAATHHSDPFGQRKAG